MTRTRDFDPLLRSLDAADPHGPADPRRASADLHRILATDPTQAPSQPPAVAPTTRPRRLPGRTTRPHRRVAVLGGLVAAVTAGFVILPALSGGDPAFATWTAAPVGMTAQDQAGAAAECRASKKHVGDGMYAGDIDAASVAIAERVDHRRTHRPGRVLGAVYYR